MNHTNIEIKARCSKKHQDEIRNYLNNNNAKYIGIDNQTDIYFQVKKGRLKLRKGNIENSLIYYERNDERDSKKSKVIICKNNEPSPDLENIVKQIHDVLIEVNKKREIYFIGNVKFHIDEVIGLGNFIEIEAISEDNSLSEEKIKKQCNYYKRLFNINDKDLISNSYSDMLLNKRQLELK
jgi:predicted adenylyl cyclase CyaB